MFDSMQSVEIPVEKSSVKSVAKANRIVNERALLLLMAATISLSTMALVGVLAVSA